MIQGGKINQHKINIAHKVRPISDEDATKDIENLINIHPTKKDLNRRMGNTFIDFYMFPYRLDVITYKHKGINCSYVGYICPHPLKQLMIVRLTLDDQTDAEKFKQFLIDNSYEIIRELEKINIEWIKFNEKKK